MAFDQFQFKYNPPATIPSPSPAPSRAAASLVTGTANAADSRVGRLISRIGDIQETNQFLQKVILARSSTLALEHDPAVDPETARALQALYPNLGPPSSLSIPMYNRTLDAEITALQIESGLGKNSSYEVDPHQAAAASQINRTIETGLIDSGQFQYHLPLLLRQLKGDTVLFNNMTAHLGQYPVMTAPTTSSVSASDPNRLSVRGQDVSLSLDNTLNGALDSFQRSYASVYQLSVNVGVVAADVNSILDLYFYEPAENIIRSIAMFQSLQGFVHATRMKDIVKGLTGFVFIRLIAEAMAMECLADRFYQTAVVPLRSMTSSMGFMLQEIGAAAEYANTVVNGVRGSFVAQTGSLEGISLAYDCGMPHNAGIQKPLNPSVARFSDGLRAVASHLSWALDKADSKIGLLEESFQKLLSRRLDSMNAQLDLMCSLQALNTMTQLASAVLSFKSNSPALGSSGTIPQTAAVGQILTGMKSATGTAFVVSGGSVRAVPPSLPQPSDTAQKVLKQGGLNLIVASTNVKAPDLGVSS